MEKNISAELLRKYLAGECEPEETARIYDWYDSFENDADPMFSLTPEERIALKEMMFDRVMQNLHSMDQLPRRGMFPVKAGYAVLGGVAAVLLLLFGINILFKAPQPGGALPAEVTAVNTGEKCREIVIENKLKTIHRQTLPDGSVVWLKPATRILYPEKFGAGKREVRMTGEAFFEVSRDVSKPFVVYSGEIVTRVLGTSFNIKAYEKDASAEVSVFTGQVSVSLPSAGGEVENKGILLAKDEKAVFLHKSKLLEKQQYNIQKQPELNIWKKNSISFDNTPVKEVVKVLNAEFDVALRVYEGDKELNSYMLKADFTDQNLPDILQMLEKSLNLTYEIEGKEIVLKLDK